MGQALSQMNGIELLNRLGLHHDKAANQHFNLVLLLKATPLVENRHADFSQSFDASKIQLLTKRFDIDVFKKTRFAKNSMHFDGSADNDIAQLILAQGIDPKNPS